ncbi:MULTISPECIES: hypothetical protein [Bacillus]|uniref:hypothetical protein n=1 Tax=Bacillus TaxID=1386 RepID=UPI001B28D248|nr:hypothetical protein [Bacillus sonorensis]MDI3410177.1 hypothetical protein [Bacillus sonorensis]GIN69097.1 hypothetical protein J41TS2_45180 [Bacillus sonorensis]
MEKECIVKKFSKEDYIPKFEEDFEEVCRHLQAHSQRLFELLPDISLSPDERLERLARVIPTSILKSANHKTAREKLNGLRHRLDELIPDQNMSYYDKIEYLVNIADEMVPGQMKMYEKLEEIGDKRWSDIGRS